MFPGNYCNNNGRLKETHQVCPSYTSVPSDFKLPVQSVDDNYANQAWLVVWVSDFISLICVHEWVCVRVRVMCACHSHYSVCALVCALFWLWACWCCTIMSSIISPVNMPKSSCPWEKLWKGECQYWQTNKFWQRGDFWTIGQGYRHGPVGMSCKANARWDMVCFLLASWTCNNI